MKRNTLIAGLILSFLASFAQDAKMLLKQSYEKCQSVQNGYYEMTQFMKYMSQKDTSKVRFICYFKKLKNDTLFSSAFHYKTFFKGIYSDRMMYTGDDFVSFYNNDSTALIISKSKWAADIKSFSGNCKFYSPLTNRKSYPLPHDSDFIDKRHIFKFIGEENLNGSLCYLVQVNLDPKNESSEMMKMLRIEYHYWIKKEDFIPIQYSTAMDMLMNSDTMYQYEKIVLNKYEINNLEDENILTLNSIPSFYKTKDYVPYKSPPLLSKDTLAPNWELFSLTNEKVNLKGLKGQLVLIDFFYKSCYPCMQALPVLQSLNEKYKEKGLRVIGIDPYDKKQDDLDIFLKKRGVTYTVLLGGKDVAKDYRVSGYPTMYLIDRSGKIIFIQVGYGKDVDNMLDDIIKKNL